MQQHCAVKITITKRAACWLSSLRYRLLGNGNERRTAGLALPLRRRLQASIAVSKIDLYTR